MVTSCYPAEIPSKFAEILSAKNNGFQPPPPPTRRPVLRTPLTPSRPTLRLRHLKTPLKNAVVVVEERLLSCSRTPIKPIATSAHLFKMSLVFCHKLLYRREPIIQQVIHLAMHYYKSRWLSADRRNPQFPQYVLSKNRTNDTLFRAFTYVFRLRSRSLLLRRRVRSVCLDRFAAPFCTALHVYISSRTCSRSIQPPQMFEQILKFHSRVCYVCTSSQKCISSSDYMPPSAWTLSVPLNINADHCCFKFARAVASCLIRVLFRFINRRFGLLLRANKVVLWNEHNKRLKILLSCVVFVREDEVWSLSTVFV